MARTRSAKIANSAAAAHDVDFPHLWRQLRAAGWTSKAPRGLETDWLYVAPGGSGVFAGEHALVEHTFRSGLLDAATTDTTETSPGTVDTTDTSTTEASTATAGTTDTSTASTSTATACATAMAGTAGTTGRVGPSQIDTSVTLSQGTLNALFDSPVVVAARDGEDGAARHQAVASSQLPSEASGLDSEYEQPDATLPAVSGRVLRTRVTRIPVKEDVNFISLAENTSDYESLSSGASDGEVFEDDDDNVDRTGAQDEDDVLSDADAVEMDDAFIEALRIG
ncbi:hypothetical protein BBJ28_00016115, partial [Nothophytophthora sp. Chile5]